MMRKALVLAIGAILVAALIFLARDNISKFLFRPTGTSTLPGTKVTETVDEEMISVVAENLEIPWEIEFLPNGDLLVTERPGNLLRIGPETKLVKKIEGVEHVGEGGLLGLALHPQFETNNYIYLYLTTKEGGQLTNRVERYKLTGDSIEGKEIILDGISGAQYHDGGRIRFGPDGNLYITTGDAGDANSAQDPNSLSGKILRVKDDGGIPEDNPFQNEVYSLGHRNPQGLAWDNEGRLWSTEHGPSGMESGYDELNLITMGANYGWPFIRGSGTSEGLVSPIIQSGSDETWAPAGMAYLDGSLFFAGLRGETLYEAKLNNGGVEKLVSHFREEFGRLRAVTVSPDGYLYISTSNMDGRGNQNPRDDKIIKINPLLLK